MVDSFQDRVEEYLGRNGQRDRGVRVVPLTGDASDRRYFRLIEPDGQTSVLAANVLYEMLSLVALRLP